MAENSNKYSIAYPSAQSDANNFADGVSIVTDPTNVSHLPATGARTVVFTNTLLESPQRKVQFAQDLNSCYIRSLITTGWTAWEKLALDSKISGSFKADVNTDTYILNAYNNAMHLGVINVYNTPSIVTSNATVFIVIIDNSNVGYKVISTGAIGISSMSYSNGKLTIKLTNATSAMVYFARLENH